VVAVLFAEEHGVYSGRSDVDVWHIEAAFSEALACH